MRRISARISLRTPVLENMLVPLKFLMQFGGARHMCHLDHMEHPTTDSHMLHHLSQSNIIETKKTYKQIPTHEYLRTIRDI